MFSYAVYSTDMHLDLSWLTSGQLLEIHRAARSGRLSRGGSISRDISQFVDSVRGRYRFHPLISTTDEDEMFLALCWASSEGAIAVAGAARLTQFNDILPLEVLAGEVLVYEAEADRWSVVPRESTTIGGTPRNRVVEYLDSSSDYIRQWLFSSCGLEEQYSQMTVWRESDKKAVKSTYIRRSITVSEKRNVTHHETGSSNNLVDPGPSRRIGRVSKKRGTL